MRRWTSIPVLLVCLLLTTPDGAAGARSADPLSDQFCAEPAGQTDTPAQPRLRRAVVDGVQVAVVLPPGYDAAALDRHLALVAKKCSWAEIERQIKKARAEHDPDEAERRRIAAAEKRCVEVHYRAIGPDGMVPITGYAALADALAFDAWVGATAAGLDPSVPLDVRRSMALGRLAGGGQQAPKELVLYAHARPGQAMVEVENTRTTVTPDQVRQWCHEAGTKVTIRPVLDLAEELSTDLHDPTPLLREQAWARFPTCMFPDCERSARGCDLDHRNPYPTGATTTSNLTSC